MVVLLITVTALAVSMMVIPVMLRLAPQLGLVDRPSARKVHHIPMARVGGWGIVVGSLAPLLIFLDLGDPLSQSFLWGALVLLAFGTWDDSREVGHYPKFVGQLLAVIPVVYYGDLWVYRFPFLDEELPAWIGQPFTVIAIIGVINALNHSDGLDGLAGGEALLSIIAILLLGYQADGGDLVYVGAAVIGGLLGFLRYNTHPARLFMGDSGSQFLGFTLAFMVVLLTQQTNTAISPAAPALLLGLPVVDIITVLGQRIYHGMNWFKATKNHVHHRLLDLEFSHYQSVVIIYSFQAALVLTGVYLCYSWDWLIITVYLAAHGALFAVLLGAKRAGWRANRRGGATRKLDKVLRWVATSALCTRLPIVLAAVAISLVFLAAGMFVSQVPRDFGLMSLALFAVIVITFLYRKQEKPVSSRAVIYATGVFVAYLWSRYTPVPLLTNGVADIVIFGSIAVLIGMSVRCIRDVGFATSPMDYLIVFATVVFAITLSGSPEKQLIAEIVVKSIILLYGCELILHHARRNLNLLSAATVASLGILAYRGLVV